MNIRPVSLILRCYADKEGNQWQAFCLDLSLAAQASSFEEAKHKLERMIGEYVYDALVGEDKVHADALLNRRAPLSYWLKYHWYFMLCKVGSVHKELRRIFKEPLPLTVQQPYNHA
ncbi:MAG: DUF1902 domain-containing protein [Pseudomonadota bacterium]